MARAAVLGRLTWLAGQLAAVREETATARTLVLDVPGWAGHLPGQHVDVRLTAEDGYSTERSYSIASAPGRTRLELTIQRLDDGEVSRISWPAQHLMAVARVRRRCPVTSSVVGSCSGSSSVQIASSQQGLNPYQRGVAGPKPVAPTQVRACRRGPNAPGG